MKLVKMSLVAMLIATTAAHAKPGEVSLGVHGSLNWASSHNSDVVDSAYNAGNLDHGSNNRFMLGLRSEVGISDWFFLQPELNYTQKGFGLTNRGTNNKVSVNLDYLSLPLLAKAKFFPGSVIRPYIYAGPELSVRVGAETHSGGVNTPTNGYKDADFLINVGGGIEAQVSDRVSLFSDVRYSRGLVNVISNPAFGQSIYTSTLMAMLGAKMTL